MTSVRHLTTAAEAAEAGRVLGRAFVTDPLSLWLLGGRPDPQTRLTRTFSAFADSALRNEGAQLLMDEGRRAAAVWLPPGQWRAPKREVLRHTPALLRSYGTALPRALRVLLAIEKVHPPGRHWYLEAIGTVPEARGQGVGATLLEPVLARCDADGLPAYLESSNPQNIPFYERHGFVRRPEVPLPAGCPVVTPMWRDPR